MVALSPKGEGCLFILKQIGFETVLLFADPGEGQTGGKEHVGAGHTPDIQLPCNACKRQDIIVRIVHLVGGELLVFVSDDIISVVKDEHIAFEGGLLVVGRHTGLKAGVSRFDVSVTVVKSRDSLS